VKEHNLQCLNSTRFGAMRDEMRVNESLAAPSSREENQRPEAAVSRLRSASIIMLGTLLACTSITILIEGEQRTTAGEQQGAAAGTARSDDVPETCPVTKPSDRPFVPPSPYPTKASKGSFWFGTDHLWTALPVDGTWKGLPHYTPSDPTFRQKLFWGRQGYDWHTEPQPKLTVTGRRLDSSAPPLLSDRANNGWVQEDQPFMVVGINFPTLGCLGNQGTLRRR
jgi:hypothetical protein